MKEQAIHTANKWLTLALCRGAALAGYLYNYTTKTTVKYVSQKRTKYIGSWSETPYEKVELPFTIESLRFLLRYGASTDSPYTHQQISDWAYSFWWECAEGFWSESSDPRLSADAEITLDANAQWELFLVNTYSIRGASTA